MKNSVPKCLDTLSAVLMLGACGILVIVDTLAVSTDVLVRWLAGKTWAGLFEIVEYSLLWLAFLGLPWVTRKRMHVRVELLASRISPHRRAVLEGVATACSLLALGITLWYTFAQTLVDFLTKATVATVLVPPKWPIEVVIPVGLAVAIVIEVAQVFQRRERDPSDNER
ncbi:MAG: TRAP transporter small permease [Moorellales bacterium]